MFMLHNFGNPLSTKVIELHDVSALCSATCGAEALRGQRAGKDEQAQKLAPGSQAKLRWWSQCVTWHRLTIAYPRICIYPIHSHPVPGLTIHLQLQAPLAKAHKVLGRESCQDGWAVWIPQRACGCGREHRGQGCHWQVCPPVKQTNEIDLIWVHLFHLLMVTPYQFHFLNQSSGGGRKLRRRWKMPAWCWTPSH